MKAALLDRDGVINQKAPEGEYIAHWREMQFLPDVFSSVAALERAGFKIIIVTNQRGIALGKVRAANLENIHRQMTKEFSSHGVHLTAIYVCPHDLTDHCSCRKPNPDLLLRAAEEHGVDLPSSWMIGDSPSDVEAGRRLGCICLSGCFSKPQAVVWGRAAANVSENLARVPVHVRYRRGLQKISR